MKVFVLLALVAVAFACQDKSPRCPRYRPYCRRSNVIRNYCPVTCGACPGQTTAAPPPTKAPVTKATVPTNPPQTVTFPNGACGMRMVSTARVIGGQDAKPGQWPWQILLLNNGRPSCGGSIINKRYVITAAHCVSRNTNARYYSVKAGETDRNKNEGTEATYQAEKVIVHKNYGRLNNDIALIKLNKDIAFTKYVQPVCMPSGDIPVGTKNCYISGFGKIRHPGSMHTKLQHAVMPPVSNSVCYAKNRRIVGIQISPAMICAGEGGVNPISGCHGDSGGPYVCEVNGRFELHGAVSWGSPRCSSKETYTVFARVNYFKTWVHTQIQANGM